MSKYYGQKIAPILEEISDSMWEIDTRNDTEPYEFPESVMLHSSKIMMNVMMDRMWFNQVEADKSIEERIAEAESLGRDFRQLMLDHLDVDMHEEIKKEFK